MAHKWPADIYIYIQSRVCRFNLYLRGTICTEEEAAQQDEEAASQSVSLYKRGRRAHYAEEPVVQLSGPVLPILLPDGMDGGGHHRLGCGQNYYK